MWNSRWLNIKHFLRTKPIVTYILSAIMGICFIISYYIDEELMWTWCNNSEMVLHHGEYVRTLTAIFLHGDLSHIVMNLLMFIPLGNMLEKEIGSFQWLILVLGSGTIANYVTDLHYDKAMEIHISVGCSGAVYGVLGALFLLVILYQGHFAGVTIQRMAFVILLAVVSYSKQNTYIDYLAHAFGAIAGFIMMIIPGIMKQRKESGNQF